MLSIAMPVLLAHPLLERFTREAVAAVRKNTVLPWELIILVHGGGDLAFDDPRITVLTYPERLSIARAYNLCFREAKGDYFVCLHNDTQVMPEWDMPLAAEAAAGQVAFPVVDESGGFCELRGIALRQEWLPSSCCFMLSRDLWERLGGYDERFEGMHFEDTDLWHRAQDQGATLRECPPAVVLHYRGVTRCFFPDKGRAEFAENQQKWWLKNRTPDSREPLNNPRLEGW
jgi:O-antigen biosynthesis protein